MLKLTESSLVLRLLVVSRLRFLILTFVCFIVATWRLRLFHILWVNSFALYSFQLVKFHAAGLTASDGPAGEDSDNQGADDGKNNDQYHKDFFALGMFVAFLCFFCACVLLRMIVSVVVRTLGRVIHYLDEAVTSVVPTTQTFDPSVRDLPKLSGNNAAV